MTNIKTLSLIERASQMNDDLRRGIETAERTQGASQKGTPASIGERLISLIDELATCVTQQDSELAKTRNWTARMREQVRRAISQTKEFTQRTSAELADIRRERDEAVTAVHLMRDRVDAALEFEPSMPQRAVDHLTLALRIQTNSQRRSSNGAIDKNGAVVRPPVSELL